MAKALVGHLPASGDPRVSHRLAHENRQLKQRVADLEALVVRLQADNDAHLVAERDRDLLTLTQMQPV